MKYRGEIDGLRTLAVVPVILFHAGIAPFGGGFIGVDVFFVISGYLISTIIINELDEGRFSILRFYERRARRILPALFFVMLACVPFAWFWLMPRDLRDFAESLTAVTFFVSNFLFWMEAGYFETTAELKPLLHTWSLAVEEQYYIIFPVLMMILMPLGQRVVMISLVVLFIASLILSQWGIYNRPSATFFLLPARGWELLVGVFAAIYLRKNPDFTRTTQADLLSIAGLILIVVPIFIYTHHTPFPGAYALPATIGTGLIILFARKGTIANRLLATRPMVAIGLVSYSAYLWHQPVFAFFKHRFGSAMFEDFAFALIALSLLLATFSYWVVERPFRRTASVKQLCLSMAGCFVLVAGATTVFLTTVHENYKAVPSYQWALENASPELIKYLERRDVRRDCDTKIKELGLQYCRFGVADQEPTIVMWGDSLSGASLHGMHELALQNGVAGMAFVADGCPPVLGLRNTALSTCTAATHAEVIEQIRKLPNVETVLIIGNLSVAMEAGNVLFDGEPTSPTLVRGRVGQAVDLFREMGAKTILVEQGPIYDAPVAEHEIQRIRSDHDASQTISRQDQLASVAPTRGLADVVDGYIETVDFYCDAASCPSIDGDGNMVIFDRNHVTKNYSEKLAALIFSHLDLGT
ncbi:MULTISPECIES: acyltransferase family protein [unclassified Roseovarius]|uniref:acyltransferase family protein n=1 Tax=unclassified Roseovarius TaxID=2614913 RepID=UPI00273F2F84|nr:MULTISPECIES: acyltransferase family protein [unclassified Roseovarius]